MIGVIILSFVGAFKIDCIIRYALGAVGLVCYLALVVTFRSSAEFNSRSKALLRRWKGLRGKYDPDKRRIYITLREFEISIGTFGYVDTTLVLTLSGIILNNFINFLIITDA